jgi:phage baseplate assembly protein W
MKPITQNMTAATRPATPRAQLPSRTYAIDWHTGRVVGFVDGQAAMRQAIHKILNTKRFAHVIYSWNYGMEWDKLIGQDHTLIQRELEGLLRQALCQDERILAVSQVRIERLPARRGAVATLVAETIFGKMEVTTNV